MRLSPQMLLLLDRIPLLPALSGFENVRLEMLPKYPSVAVDFESVPVYVVGYPQRPLERIDRLRKDEQPHATCLVMPRPKT